MDFYTSREDKPNWLINTFSEIFQDAKKVLDVGCDRKQLSNFTPSHISYTGIDISKEADIQFNLDSGDKLPVDEKGYDLVVCLEVLEHVEEIHFVFDELCRASSRYIIISLPNPFSRIFFSYILGRKAVKDPEQEKTFGNYMKFYGLPFEKPVDRHRWFFNTEESINFIKYRANLNGYKLVDVQYSINMHKRFRRLIRFILAGFSKKRMYNFFNVTTTFLLERQP